MNEPKSIVKSDYYIYLISTGDYSGYSILYLAVRDRQCTKEDMEQLKVKLINQYKATGLPIADDDRVPYNQEEKLWELFLSILEADGFQVVNSSGEFHFPDVMRLSDIDFDCHQWISNREPSAFKIGLG